MRVRAFFCSDYELVVLLFFHIISGNEKFLKTIKIHHICQRGVKVYLKKLFESNYCKAVFVISFVVAYFLIPKSVFSGYYSVLGVGFMFSFSLVVTCLVRDVKERVVIERGNYKGHLLGLVFSVVGLTALHTCTVGVHICGAALGLSILSLTPSFLAGFFVKYSVMIVVFSVVIQLVTLYYMNCFKK